MNNFVTMKVDCIMVQEVEYIRLNQENKELRTKIEALTNESIKLNTDIMSKNLEIEILRKENQELKEKLKLLEDRITNQDSQISKLKGDNKNLKIEITDLKLYNQKRKNKEILNKIILGLQDYNALDKLETKLSDPTELIYLHNDRIDECHYINTNYSQLEKDFRINILIDKINNADMDVLTMFDNKYPNLLNDLKPYLVKKNISNINQRFIDRTNNWWDIS
jgi:chromosome segregation ATPase